MSQADELEPGQLMVVVQCPQCLTRYRVADQSLGKLGKCKKCGEPFTLAAVAEGLEDDLLGALAQGQTQQREALPTAPVPPPLPPDTGLPSSAASPTQPEQVTGFESYLRDVGRSLLFFTRLGNLVTFAIVVFIVALRFPLSAVPFFGPLLVLIVIGWYMAFQLNVVLAAAGGDPDLPDLMTGDWGEGILLPLLKYLASWVMALVPFAIGLGYLVAFDQLDIWEALRHFGTALGGNFLAAFDTNQGGGPLLGLILLFAMTLWPMMLLVVAVGGMRSLVRFDLMVLTMFRTLPAYILVVILAYIGVVGPSLLVALGWVAVNPDESTRFGLLFAVAAFGVILQVYGNIFTMRVAGLYYHHFKHRFAWSWG
jgi:predicted Zn finger-like uncharacterized protein